MATVSNDSVLAKERSELLEQLERALEWPMLLLGFVWLGLLITEFVWGLSRELEFASNLIWAVFILDFGVKLGLATSKVSYLHRNWLTVIALVVPALRIFRLAQAFRLLRLARTTRGLRLLRVVTALNRGMRSLSAAMSRRGVGYVALLTSLVTLAGAGGIFVFEKDGSNSTAFHSFGSSLWWTAMIMTTMGSEVWPRTPEGRLLCLLLAIYAFAVFGYVTAAIASFFVGREAANNEGDLPNVEDIVAVREELRALREEVSLLRKSLVTAKK